MWSLILLSILLLPMELCAQAPAKTLAELRTFYAANCVRCHGQDGSARSAEGVKLGGFDFTNAKEVAEETDADMVKTIRKGLLFGIRMPAFADRLSEEEARLLVREVLRKAEKGKAI